MTAVGFRSYDAVTASASVGCADHRHRLGDLPEEEIAVDLARSSRPDATPEALSDRDRQILEFERQWWKYAGAKEQAIRDLFDMSATRYYQIVNALIDSPEALAFDPMLVKRLRRMRAARQRSRSARRLGIDLDV
jgi:hypothetical protein